MATHDGRCDAGVVVHNCVGETAWRWHSAGRPSVAGVHERASSHGQSRDSCGQTGGRMFVCVGRTPSRASGVVRMPVSAPQLGASTCCTVAQQGCKAGKSTTVLSWLGNNNCMHEQAPAAPEPAARHVSVQAMKQVVIMQRCQAGESQGQVTNHMKIHCSRQCNSTGAEPAAADAA